MKNVFISFTPYHILLSYAIALDEEKSAKNCLFVISDFGDVDPLVYSLEGWSRCPFAQIERLPGVYGQVSRFRRHFLIKRVLIPITEFVTRHKIECVYVFNDGRPETQAALHFAKKANKSTVGIYVEDGAGAYSAYKSTKRPLYKILLAKLFYGPWWQDTRVLGTSRWIDEVKAIFPQFVRPELHSKPITPIPKHALLELRNQGWPYEYLKALRVDNTELDNLDAVLIVAHSEFANHIAGYKQVIADVLSIAKSEGLRLGIKYHPREPQDDFLSVHNTEGITVLPQSMPIELLYILTSEQIRLVIGDISTSLLTAKWLLDNAIIVSIAPLIGQTDSQLLRTFNKLSIRIVKNTMEVQGIFQLLSSTWSTNFNFKEVAK